MKRALDGSVWNADGAEQYGSSLGTNPLPAPQVAPFKASRAARSAAAAQLDKPRASNQQVPAKRARASTPACSTDVEADKMWLQSSGAQAAAKKPEAKAPRPLQLLLQEDKGLLAAAERIIAGRKLHDAAKDDVHAAYRVWRNRNPKRYPDKRKIEKKLKIFEQNARDLRDYDAKYPNKLTRVGLNLLADVILYSELMAPHNVPRRKYKGGLPFSRPPPNMAA
ncbi:g5724 [Coccomyxa viridis]|uniref:G5724 protein n=1 Tax=Coccomyxa viridis TaxID=1274662 RepID=A0ABP1FVU6_9CHLO